MIEERIYPTYKIATLNQVLVQQGVSPSRLLEDTGAAAGRDSVQQHAHFHTAAHANLSQRRGHYPGFCHRPAGGAAAGYD